LCIPSCPYHHTPLFVIFPPGVVASLLSNYRSYYPPSHIILDLSSFFLCSSDTVSPQFHPFSPRGPFEFTLTFLLLSLSFLISILFFYCHFPRPFLSEMGSIGARVLFHLQSPRPFPPYERCTLFSFFGFRFRLRSVTGYCASTSRRFPQRLICLSFMYQTPSAIASFLPFSFLHPLALNRDVASEFPLPLFRSRPLPLLITRGRHSFFSFASSVRSSIFSGRSARRYPII